MIRFMSMASASLIGLAATMLAPTAAQANSASVAVRDSFRIGNAGVVCTAQYTPTDRRLENIYDRGYKLVCRDAAAPVGSMLALRDPVVSTRQLHDVSNGAAVQCEAPVADMMAGVGAIEMIACRDSAASLDYRRYIARRGGQMFVSEGLAGYDAALRLGLATIVADQLVPGTVEVASTLVSDPASFARVQAGALDARGARREAYGRNNGGSYAQAAEFFDVLAARRLDDLSQTAEFLANSGLQQSNLGNFAAAEAQFVRAERRTGRADFVTQRMIRNFRAINALNNGRADQALAALDVQVAPVTDDASYADLGSGVISRDLSDAINREDATLRRISGGEAGLTPADRAAVLDGQALQLRGTAAAQEGRLGDARALFNQSIAAVSAVRGGRITSLGWLRSETLAELAKVAERENKPGEAEAFLRQGLMIFETEYPLSPSMLAAKARLASHLIRKGDQAEGRALFAALTSEAEQVADSSAAIRDLLAPYFSDLVASGRDSTANQVVFRASQILQRPGVAQTQAILARELSEGNDQASALFRLALTRSREIVRLNAAIAGMDARSDLVASELQMLAEQRETLALLEREQTALTAQLSQFPAYKAVSPQAMSLAEIQAQLRPGEGYYRVMLTGGKTFAQLIRADGATSFEVPLNASQLYSSVTALRDSIVRSENGQIVTYPFDVDMARSLYKALFDPVSAEMASVRHLIFEPDGPMMQLPPYLLIASDEGIAAYREQASQPDGDEFDFTGIDWLGKNREVSIAVSPRSFADVRTIAPSRGRMRYLGLGQNARPAGTPPIMAVADECQWPLATWQAPIRDAELRLAASIVGPGQSRVVTDGSFTDEALTGASSAVGDLSDYRILHFATHGLVTAPRPQCPSRPALVTSFGGAQSDGLLSFREVFDMKLDADVVILSACDTAGMATVSASREAGVATGGNYALDGLVRAFVGAGARSVLASHWPVPDDFDATNRLIGGMFRATPGTGLGSALSTTQRSLMDDPATSHPYYWAAFVVLGDGTKPLIGEQ